MGRAAPPSWRGAIHTYMCRVKIRTRLYVCAVPDGGGKTFMAPARFNVVAERARLSLALDLSRVIVVTL